MSPHRAADGLSSLQLRLVALTLLLLPLNWLLGTALLWTYAVSAILLLSVERLSLLEGLYGALAAVLVLALGIAMLNDGIPGDRILASLYNLTIILVLVAFANFGRKAQLSASAAAWTARIYRAAFWCLAAQLAWIAALAFYVRATGTSQIMGKTLLLGALGELPGVLFQYARLQVVITDWLTTGAVARIIGFGVYATEGALLVLIVGLLAAIHAGRRRRWFLLAAMEAAIAAALVAMASRTTLLAFLLSLGLVGALWGRRVSNAMILVAPLVVAGIAIAAIYGPGFLENAFEQANKARAGSSGERFKSYLMAIDLVRETNLLTGLGVKPRDESILSIPIGSHSSLISSFTKGGLVGLAAMLAIYAVLLWRVIRAQLLLYRTAARPADPETFELVYLSRIVLVLLIWWVTEDFDAPAHGAAIAGLAIGLFWGLGERNASRARPAWAPRPAAPRSPVFAR